MSKQLNVSLAFNADTSAAKRNLDELKKHLASISSMSVDSHLSDDIRAASTAARDLQTHLGNAMNMNTGNLDLSKLQKSLKQSSQSLTSLTSDLMKAGVSGEQAFLSISKSIANANLNLNKTQGLLGEFMTTMKNTARWQLSSSLLHGFMGALQSSISYAQQLDRSLNDIRIVSGLNADAMAQFAEEANKSAKALSTTTNAYAQAALIFYQQGLDDDAVKERTDAVIKMSNVTRESEEDVSSYMTAIWNNFRGEKAEIEEYADVITALGAATASSSAEIAGGLEKFAAIGQQIGLSYDYATTALATVVAKTRQSEDVVGTAFKTIFARIQGLNLGETLDDGTDLNKYSKALMAVGINIKDTNGDLKDMDVILNEMGAKWQTLSRDQQTALAQTVAGVRQYNQLVALMDSWQTDFQDNLQVAQNSKGELSKQANIYAESWDAAKDRVRASLEAIYSDLIPEETIINLTDGFAKVLNVVDVLIDSFGGLQNIVLLLASVMVSKFQANISHAIDSGISKAQQLGTTLKNVYASMSNGGGQAFKALSRRDSGAIAHQGSEQVKHYEETGKSSVQKDYSASLETSLNSGPVTAGFEAQVKNLQTIDKLQSKIAVNAQNLTGEEREKLEVYLQQVQTLGEIEAKIADEIEKIKEEQELLINTDLSSMYNNIDYGEGESVSLAATDSMGTGAQGIAAAKAEAAELNKLLVDAGTILGHDSDIASKLTFAFDSTNNSVRITALSEESMLTMRQTGLELVQNNAQVNADISKILASQSTDLAKKGEALEKIVTKALAEKKITEDQAKALQKGVKAYVKSNGSAKTLNATMAKNTVNAHKFADAMGTSRKAISQAEQNGRKLSDSIRASQQAAKQTSDAISQVTGTLSAAAERALSVSGVLSNMISGATSVVMGITQISNAIDQISDPDVSWTQKLMSGVMAAGSAVTAFSTIMKGFQSVLAAVNSVEAASVTIKAAVKASTDHLTASQAKENAMLAVKQAWLELGNDATDEEIAKLAAKNMTQLTGISLDQKEALGKVLLSGAKKSSATASTLEATAEAFDGAAKAAAIAPTIGLTVANGALALSFFGLTIPLLPLIAILLAVIAAVVAVTAAFKAKAEATKKSREEDIKAAKEAKEAADATKALIDTYAKCYKEYEKTGEAKEELKDAALAVAEAYENEEMRVMALTGRYKELTAAVRDERNAELENALEKAQDGRLAAGEAFVEAMREGTGNFSGGKYNASIGNGAATKQWDGDEEAVGDALDELDLKYVKKDGGDIKITTGQDADEMKAAYEEVQELVRLAQENGADYSSELYSGLQEWLGKAAEAYTTFDELDQTYQDLNIQEKLGDLVKKQDIDNLSEYRDAVDEITDALEDSGMSAEDAEKAVKSYMMADADYSKFADQALVADDLIKRSGLSRKVVDEFISSLGDDLSVLASVNFDTIVSKEHLEKELSKVQAIADKEAILVKLTAVQEASSNLKDDMNVEDYRNFELSSGIDWGKDGIIEYTEFLKKSFTEQQEYLAQLSDNYHQQTSDANQKAIEEQESVLEHLRQKQLEAQEYVQNTGLLDKGKNALRDAFLADSNVHYSTSEIAQINQAIAEAEANLNSLLTDNSIFVRTLIDDTMGAVSSVEELEHAWLSLHENQAVQDAGGVDYSLYTETLIKLAEEYDNCTEAVEDYKEALASGSDEAIQAAEENLKVAMMLSDASERYGLELKTVKKQSEQLAKEYKLNAKEAATLTIQNQRMNKGVSTLVNNWEGWNKHLKESDKLSADWADAATECTLAIADLVGASEDLELPQEFFDNVDNLALIEAAIQGDTKAISTLGLEVARTTIKAKEFTEGMTDLSGREINATEFGTWQMVLSMGLDELQTQLDSLSIGDDVYEKLGGDTWAFALNEMAQTTKMSVDEMNSLLNSMGVQAEVQTVRQPQKVQVPKYQTKTEITAWDERSGMATDYTTSTSQIGTTEMDGFIDVAQINTGDAMGQKPKVQFTGNGSVSSTALSGDFGNTSSAPEEPKEANRAEYKEADDPEVERYHSITKQLELLEHELEIISKAKERAFGTEKLKAMDKEIAKLKQLEAQQKAYQETVAGDLVKDQEALAKYGAKFDANGIITNYESIMNNNGPDYSAYNSAIDKWNQMTAEEQEQADAAAKARTDGIYSGHLDMLTKTLVDPEDKAFEEFEKALSQYEETHALMQELEQALIDRQNEIYDAMLEKVAYTVEVKLDVQDRDIQYLEFLLERIEDSAYNAAKAITNLGLQASNALKQIDIAKSGIQGILENHGMDAGAAKELIESGDLSSLATMFNFTEEEMSTMDGWIDTIMDKNSEMLEMRTEAWQNVRDEFNEYLEEMDKGIEKIDYLKSVTENYQNIIDIVGTGVLGVSNELIDELNSAIVKQSNDALKATKAEVAALKSARQDLIDSYDDGWSEDAKREYQQTLDEMNDAILDKEAQAMDYWQQSLEAATEAWNTAVTHIVDEFEDKVAGALGSLTELQEAFDRAAEVDDRYVDDYEKIYELSKLTRQINNDIDTSDNLHVKQELRDLAEEIAEIEASGVQMSKYDIENLQRRYELKKAELALEESKGAKSSVNMVRGADGSYSYVYTANEDDVEAAEQNYEDKLYAMQVANGDYINSLQEQIIQTQTECADAIRALQDDTSLSTEEYQAKVAEITAYYEGKLAYYNGELGKVLGNNKTLYEDDWMRYSEATGYKISTDENYVMSFEQTALSILTGFTTMEEAQMTFNSNMETLLVELSGAYSTWQSEIDEAMQLAGTSVDTFGQDVDEAVNGDGGIIEQSGAAAEEVQSMAETMIDAFGQTTEAIAAWEEDWGSKIDAAIEKNNELIESYNRMKSILAEGVDNTSSAPLDNSGSDDSSDGGNDSGSGGNGGADGKLDVGDTVTYVGGTYYEQSSGKGRTGSRGPGKQVKVTKIKEGANYPIHVMSSDSAYGWLRKDQLTGFDTGGYTGNWGDTSGRLALLHQKELVLNASDTANLLSIVDMVREIANIIDLNAAAASGVYSSITSAGGIATGGSGMTQHVEIHASFPDAVDHSEIEQAFNNLINTASQYANRDR